MANISSILQSLDQASNAKELNKAIDAVLANIHTKPIKTLSSDFPDDVETGTLSNRQPQEKMVSSSHVRGVLIELMLLNKKMQSLQTAFIALQSHVDANYMDILNSTISWITTQADALKAEAIYNSHWFSSLAISIDAKQQIAQSLIDTCATYKVTNGFWQQLVDSNDAAVEFSAYNPKA